MVGEGLRVRKEKDEVIGNIKYYNETELSILAAPFCYYITNSIHKKYASIQIAKIE